MNGWDWNEEDRTSVLDTRTLLNIDPTRDVFSPSLG